MAATASFNSCSCCGSSLAGTERYCPQCGVHVARPSPHQSVWGVMALVAPPVVCLMGSLQRWVTPVVSARLNPAWRGPWSLGMLGWPGTMITILIALAVLCSIVWATRPERLPPIAKVLWRLLGVACLGAGLGALTLAASPFAGHLASATELFGLGAWFGIAAGGRLFILGALAWTLVSETQIRLVR